MAIAGQRVAQQAQRAGTQSSRALGRAASRAGGTVDELIVQLDDGWYRITEDPDTGRSVKEPYEMNIERKV